MVRDGCTDRLSRIPLRSQLNGFEESFQGKRLIAKRWMKPVNEDLEQIHLLQLQSSQPARSCMYNAQVYTIYSIIGSIILSMTVL